jgi:hypothetical protein
MLNLFIEQAVAYMLKVLKSGKKVTSFKNEFNAIRHGDYFEFVNLVQEPIPFMVIWKDGIASMEDEIKKDDIDFAGLLKAGPSIKKFYELCKIVYGNINDPDLSDDDFNHAVTFEIALRMHAKNFNLLKERVTLEKVIDKLCEFRNIPESDKIQLHKGRIFVNMIKQHKGRFKTWHEGLSEFNKAFEIISKNKWTIV